LAWSTREDLSGGDLWSFDAAGTDAEQLFGALPSGRVTRGSQALPPTSFGEREAAAVTSVSPVAPPVETAPTGPIVVHSSEGTGDNRSAALLLDVSNRFLPSQPHGAAAQPDKPLGPAQTGATAPLKAASSGGTGSPPGPRAIPP